ncbi:MAG TPA: hypothetical protein VF188_14820 [Longimicrobiales bacterium]
MKRLVLFLLVIIGASFSIPSLRERIAPRVQPLWASVRGTAAPKVRDALGPVYRWIAVREVRTIVEDLERYEAAGQRLPRPNGFEKFLDNRSYSLIDGRDPWGTPYMMLLRRDSIIVLSSGPDLESGTADDIRGAAPRR